MGDGKPVNWKDIGYKVAWTAASAGGATLLAYLADAPYGWVPLATAAINTGLAWLRQKLGATPPEAPKTTVS